MRKDRQIFQNSSLRSTENLQAGTLEKACTVEGSLRNNDYINNQGVKRYSVDVQAERVYFADGKDDAPGGFTQQPSLGHPHSRALRLNSLNLVMDFIRYPMTMTTCHFNT